MYRITISRPNELDIIHSLPDTGRVVLLSNVIELLDELLGRDQPLNFTVSVIKEPAMTPAMTVEEILQREG